MVSFRGVNGGKRSFFDSFDQDDNEADELGEYLHQAEKKRRLTDNQVQFLEKSFGEENKLEPERKVQLAKELGLQPRQIAIWFQNRRARWKTKQLEKDYDELRNRYDTLKSNYNNLLKEKEDLRTEVRTLHHIWYFIKCNFIFLSLSTMLVFDGSILDSGFPSHR